MGPGRASGAEPEGVFQNVESSPRRPAPHARLALVGFVGLCLLVGLVDGLATRGGLTGWYETLIKPPGQPPGWVFPVVWSALYVAMAVAAWRVWRHAGVARRGHYRALRLWGWQLLVNATWSPMFFGLHAVAAALAVIAVLGCLVAATWRAFARLDRVAGVLMVPYLVWIGYAAYLDAATLVLN